MLFLLEGSKLVQTLHHINQPKQKIQRGTRYVEFFSLLGDQIFGSVHSAFSDLRFNIRSGSVFSFEKCESLVSTMFR